MVTEHGTMFYWLGGKEDKDAKTIVFIHGMTADHTMFDQQVIHFKESYKLICLDLPCHGKSRPYDAFSYAHVACVLNKILDLESIGKVNLVGQSMGGYVCQEFANHYPTKVESFVGVDTSPFGHDYYARWERYILKSWKNVSLFSHKRLVRSIAKSATCTEYAYDNLYRSVSTMTKEEIISIMDQGYGELLNRIETIKYNFPVLLVIGDKDKTGNVKKYNKKWASLEGYPLKIIPDASHNSNVDNYKAFNKIVDDFFSSIV